MLIRRFKMTLDASRYKGISVLIALLSLALKQV